MTNNVTSRVVYVEIETLLDLRQGFLVSNTTNHEELTKYLLSNEYNYRRYDDFSRFTDKSYKDSIRNKEKSLLTNSLMTYIVGVVVQKLAYTETLDKIEGVTTTPVLWINQYPFSLSQEELELMRDFVFYKTGEKYKIEIFSKPKEEITPLFLANSGVKSAIFYSFHDWIELHGVNLKDNPSLEIDYYFAPILETEVSEVELAKIKELGFDDIFSYTEFILSTSLKLNFLPMSFYSNIIVAQKHLEEQTELTRKEMEERSKSLVIPEEFKKKINI